MVYNFAPLQGIEPRQAPRGATANNSGGDTDERNN